MSEYEVMQADLNKIADLKKLISTVRGEPNDLIRGMARARLEGQAINILERLLSE